MEAGEPTASSILHSWCLNLVLQIRLSELSFAKAVTNPLVDGTLGVDDVTQKFQAK